MACRKPSRLIPHFDLNLAAFELLDQVRSGSAHSPTFIAGVIGPGGAAYLPGQALPIEAATEYHRAQTDALATAGVDFLFAPTFPSAEEAHGACVAMAESGLPHVISYVLGPDGRVLDGTSLGAAVAQIDADPLSRPLQPGRRSCSRRLLRNGRPPHPRPGKPLLERAPGIFRHLALDGVRVEKTGVAVGVDPVFLMGTALPQQIPVSIQLNLDRLEPRVLPGQQTFLLATGREQIVLLGNKFLDVILNIFIAVNRHAQLLLFIRFPKSSPNHPTVAPKRGQPFAQRLPLRPAEVTPGEGTIGTEMKNILVIYASTHGHTGKIAERIAGAIRSEGFEVDLRDVAKGKDADPASHDATVVGASLHSGRHQDEMVSWIEAHREALEACPSAFFSVSLTAAEDTDEAKQATQACIDKLIEESGWTPARSVPIAGALQYLEYDFFTRTLMRLMMRRGGHPTDTSKDYDYTDWDAVDRFGREFAASARGS